MEHGHSRASSVGVFVPMMEVWNVGVGVGERLVGVAV
jgi:hypothetical protein